MDVYGIIACFWNISGSQWHAWGLCLAQFARHGIALGSRPGTMKLNGRVCLVVNMYAALQKGYDRFLAFSVTYFGIFPDISFVL